MYPYMTIWEGANMLFEYGGEPKHIFGYPHAIITFNSPKFIVAKENYLSIT